MTDKETEFEVSRFPWTNEDTPPWVRKEPLPWEEEEEKKEETETPTFPWLQEE